jgi:hypothetical protein
MHCTSRTIVRPYSNQVQARSDTKRARIDPCSPRRSRRAGEPEPLDETRAGMACRHSPLPGAPPGHGRPPLPYRRHRLPHRRCRGRDCRPGQARPKRKGPHGPPRRGPAERDDPRGRDRRQLALSHRPQALCVGGADALGAQPMTPLRRPQRAQLGERAGFSPWLWEPESRPARPLTAEHPPPPHPQNCGPLSAGQGPGDQACVGARPLSRAYRRLCRRAPDMRLKRGYRPTTGSRLTRSGPMDMGTAIHRRIDPGVGSLDRIASRLGWRRPPSLVDLASFSRRARLHVRGIRSRSASKVEATNQGGEMAGQVSVGTAERSSPARRVEIDFFYLDLDTCSLL